MKGLSFVIAILCSLNAYHYGKELEKTDGLLIGLAWTFFVGFLAVVHANIALKERK